MDELIVKQLLGEATDIELRRLASWRAAAPDNEQTYRDFVALWDQSGEAVRPSPSSPPSAADIVRVGEQRRRRARTRAARWAVVRSPVAVGAVVAAALAMLYLALPDAPPVDGPAVAISPVESSLGPDRTMTMSLSDGSVIRAASETMLEFPPRADRREVVLEGRAFFAVAEHELPFVVSTASGTVAVEGTRFEVTTSPGSLRVVVVEGSVALSSERGSSTVDAGQVAFLSEGTVARVVDRADVWALLDWRGGLLVFQATPLVQVAEEVGRHFGLPVRITDEEIGRRRITAWFGDESLDEVVSGVCIVVGARCEVGTTEVTIGR